MLDVGAAEAVRPHPFDLQRRVILRVGKNWSNEVVEYVGRLFSIPMDCLTPPRQMGKCPCLWVS